MRGLDCLVRVRPVSALKRISGDRTRRSNQFPACFAAVCLAISACANAAPVTLIGSESSRVVGSGEVALWRAVLEQALNDACIPRPNPGENRFPTPASRERDRVRATALDWFKSGGQDFSLVCDWADLPAEAVQDHAYEFLGTPAEKHSRTLRRVIWQAPGGAIPAAPQPQRRQRTSAVPASCSPAARLTLAEALSLRDRL